MKINPEPHWYRSSLSLVSIFLLPFSWMFRGIVFLRRYLYRIKIKKKIFFPIPVIIVGNITVGGTGKTPFVIWLSEKLKEKGYHPGIVSRGVGGKRHKTPCWVTETSDVHEVGDEAILLVKRTQCPLVICHDRVAAVKELLLKKQCDIVISDDGLQHYRLGRDIEIVITDGMRGFGNRQLLPAGPLREPISRLKEVNFILDHGKEMKLMAAMIVSVKNITMKIPLNEFKKTRVHAIAAIGNPTRFFSMLREKGFEVIEHIFPDHYFFKASDLLFSDTLPVIMTEKDAVKCHSIAHQHCWYIPVEVVVDDEISKKIFNSRRLLRCD